MNGVERLLRPAGASSARDAFRHTATLFAAEAVPTGAGCAGSGSVREFLLLVSSRLPVHELLLPVGAGSARDAFRHTATLKVAEAPPTGLRLNPETPN